MRARASAGLPIEKQLPLCLRKNALECIEDNHQVRGHQPVTQAQLHAASGPCVPSPRANGWVALTRPRHPLARSVNRIHDACTQAAPQAYSHAPNEHHQLPPGVTSRGEIAYASSVMFTCTYRMPWGLCVRKRVRSDSNGTRTVATGVSVAACAGATVARDSARGTCRRRRSPAAALVAGAAPLLPLLRRDRRALECAADPDGSLKF